MVVVAVITTTTTISGGRCGCSDNSGDNDNGDGGDSNDGGMVAVTITSISLKMKIENQNKHIYPLYFSQTKVNLISSKTLPTTKHSVCLVCRRQTYPDDSEPQPPPAAMATTLNPPIGLRFLKPPPPPPSPLSTAPPPCVSLHSSLSSIAFFMSLPHHPLPRCRFKFPPPLPLLRINCAHSSFEVCSLFRFTNNPPTSSILLSFSVMHF